MEAFEYTDDPMEPNDWFASSATTDYYNSYIYDKNGNIQTLERNGAGADMDQFTYNYQTISGEPSNRLGYVDDAVGSGNYPQDIDDQATGNYTYDKLGYNGMEMDNEVSGNGNSFTTEFRQYDPRLGRWKSLDPLMASFPWQSPYCAFDNNPVFFVDPLGLAAEGWIKQARLDKDGKEIKGEYKWTWDSEIKSLEQARNTEKYKNAVDYSDGGRIISQLGELGWGTNILLNNGDTRGFKYDDNISLSTIPVSTVGVWTSEFTVSKQLELLDSPITNPGAGVILMNEQGFHDHWSDNEQFCEIVNDFAWEAVMLASGESLFSIFARAARTKKIGETITKVDDAAKVGWKVGEPITNLTAKGSVPAWSTVRQRFWKNEAFFNRSAYSESNLLRMQKGLAPQRLNPNTGLMESMELHHHIVPQRNGGLFEFIKVWPDEHRALDPFRR